MPFVTITMLRGKSAEHRRAIADGVHQAMVDTFEVPPKDRFQVLRECAPDELIFDADYLGIHRSEEVVFIHITASGTRGLAQKKALFQAIAARLGRDPGLRPEDVQVVIASNQREDWSLGNGLASYVS